MKKNKTYKQRLKEYRKNAKEERDEKIEIQNRKDLEIYKDLQ